LAKVNEGTEERRRMFRAGVIIAKQRNGYGYGALESL
jgi:hypothetical protein